MLSVAAARLGFRCHIYEPAADRPRPTWRIADDDRALRGRRRPARLRRVVDVMTYEFENVPTAALDLIEALRPIRPNRRALAISQDRIAEKEFLTGLGLATAPLRRRGRRGRSRRSARHASARPRS